MLNQRFGPKLEEAFCSAFGTLSSEGNWRIEPDTDDLDGLTLVFHYPSGRRNRMPQDRGICAPPYGWSSVPEGNNGHQPGAR